MTEPSNHVRRGHGRPPIPEPLTPARVAGRPAWAIDLASARIAAGLRLIDASRLSGLARDTLSRYECATKTPPPARLARLMELYAAEAQK